MAGLRPSRVAVRTLGSLFFGVRHTVTRYETRLLEKERKTGNNPLRTRTLTPGPGQLAMAWLQLSALSPSEVLESLPNQRVLQLALGHWLNRRAMRHHDHDNIMATIRCHYAHVRSPTRALFHRD